MNTTLKAKLTQFWWHVQEGLFPFLNEMGRRTASPLKQVITVLEMLRLNDSCRLDV